MGSIFRFKEFDVNQEDCAMKINTDGVLLGAMVETENPMRILDVGSGTGVIALMLAQRFHNALVDAIDIDEVAYIRTQENFKLSKFSDRMFAFHGDFEMGQGKYDLIVSNPPFYVNALHNPDDRKRIARHADLAFFQRLLRFSSEQLSSKGTLQLILPVDLSEDVIHYAADEELTLMSEVCIRSFADSVPIRKILVFTKSKELTVSVSDFVIYQQKGVYSEGYRQFLKPFFLAF